LCRGDPSNSNDRDIYGFGCRRQCVSSKDPKVIEYAKGLSILDQLPWFAEAQNPGAQKCLLAQMAVIVVLLKRIAGFIVKVTLAFRKKIQNNKSPPRHVSIPGPRLPKFIFNLIPREYHTHLCIGL